MKERVLDFDPQFFLLISYVALNRSQSLDTVGFLLAGMRTLSATFARL